MCTVINNDQAKQIISFNLQRMMKDRGLSQADLARLMFVDVNQAARVMVNRWVKGLNPPTPADIVNLSEALGCSADEILGLKKSSKN